MNGKESADDQARAVIFDALFYDGAMTAAEISLKTHLPAKRVNTLLDYEWFFKLSGLFYIAKSDGRRLKPMLAGVN